MILLLVLLQSFEAWLEDPQYTWFEYDEVLYFGELLQSQESDETGPYLWVQNGDEDQDGLGNKLIVVPCDNYVINISKKITCL